MALFGGTFDPIHSGHLAVARAAQRRFQLDQIHFIPAGVPPHKHPNGLASYLERYAMVALACADHPDFIASLAESGSDHSGREKFYSVDTVRRFKRELSKRKRGAAGTRVYFLLGVDSFLQIQTWKNYEALLNLCNFIVATRPGFPADSLRRVIPPKLLARSNGARRFQDPKVIVLRRSTVYLLDRVASTVSATDVRRRLRRGATIRGLVPPRVHEYIMKQSLYT
jgi:nicotinate-nucleotide adenylyltransferase